MVGNDIKEPSRRCRETRAILNLWQGIVSLLITTKQACFVCFLFFFLFFFSRKKGWRNFLLKLFSRLSFPFSCYCDCKYSFTLHSWLFSGHFCYRRRQSTNDSTIRHLLRHFKYPTYDCVFFLPYRANGDVISTFFSGYDKAIRPNFGK